MKEYDTQEINWIRDRADLMARMDALDRELQLLRRWNVDISESDKKASAANRRLDKQEKAVGSRLRSFAKSVRTRLKRQDEHIKAIHKRRLWREALIFSASTGTVLTGVIILGLYAALSFLDGRYEAVGAAAQVEAGLLHHVTNHREREWSRQ